MTGFSQKILNNAVSALSAQQAIIAATANNIANVNTEGYARREVQLQTRIGANNGGLNLGTGVEASSVLRINDQFLDNLTRTTGSSAEEAGVENSFLQRVESLFPLTGVDQSIGQAMTEFFNSLDNLALNPASIELRSDVLERAEDLVGKINTTFDSLASLQAEAQNRLSNEIDSVNQLTSQIAELNGLVVDREATGNVAADARDQRDLLLDQLSEKIGYNIVEQNDGSVTISLSNGFPLVSGVNSRDIEVTDAPSFDSTPSPLLNGTNMASIVYDYDPGTGTSAHLDLTSVLQGNGGAIGGLLNVRGVSSNSATSPFEADGPLVDIAGRIEAISRDLLTRFNQAYRGGDADGATAGIQSRAIDLEGDSVDTPFGFFNLGGGVLADGVADDMSRHGDLDALVTAGTVASFSSRLSLAISRPEDIAAARTPDGDPTNAGTGNADNITAAGAVDANGDSIWDPETSAVTVEPPGIAQLRNLTATFYSNDAAGSPGFTRSGFKYDQISNETVGRVGNLAARADSDYTVLTDNHETTKSRKLEVSGVSLDEEFSSLITFQKSFEANARVLRIGQDLLDTIVQLI